MTSAIQLQLRFLAALSGVAVGGALPVACTTRTAENAQPEAPPSNANLPASTAPSSAVPSSAAPSNSVAVAPTATSTAPSSPAPVPSAATDGTPKAAAPNSAATKESLTPQCGSLRGEVQCFAPGSTHFNPGNVPNPGPPPRARFDGNRCQVQEEVRDGCCNAARSGPELIDGQCCYGFCTGVCCGRPLLIAGVPRLAPVSRRSDWCETIELELADLDARQRDELSRQWLADARMEHASIASFARFALDLLAFGAPADLLQRCQRAMADEIQHARLCFALASAYAGLAYGPGPLDLSGVAPSRSLADAAAAATREGCLNETIAALTAAEQALCAKSPALRSILERIAQDEAEHAELAWRFVAWAIQTGGPAVAQAVASALTPPAAPGAARPDEPDLRRHGRLASNESTAIARAAWTEVVLPCSRSLPTASDGALHVRHQG